MGQLPKAGASFDVIVPPMETKSAERVIERLVQQKQTGLYLKNSSEWTTDREAAWRFEDLLSVLEACHDWGLKGVQLLLKDVMSNSEIQLDLDAA